MMSMGTVSTPCATMPVSPSWLPSEWQPDKSAAEVSSSMMAGRFTRRIISLFLIPQNTKSSELVQNYEKMMIFLKRNVFFLCSI
jgi:hypothetical protein